MWYNSVLVLFCVLTPGVWTSILDDLEGLLQRRAERANAGCAENLPDMRMCNGQRDCPDGSDEDIEVCLQRGLCALTCTRFRSREQMCVKDFMLCDDRPHCTSREDESSQVCENHNRCLHRCDGACLPDNRICDHQVDCSDKSDEQLAACRRVGRPECPLLCPDERENYCVPEYRLCDTKKDCKYSHADEENCPEVQNRGLKLLEDLFNLGD